MYSIIDWKMNVFLAHVGGPFGKADKMWGIPKGEIEFEKGEVDVKNSREVLKSAVREFEEEVGFMPSLKDIVYLGTVKRKDGKIVYVWAFQGNGREKFVRSIECQLEWPPKSGKMISVPEMDDAKYFSLEDARKNIHKFQEPLLEMLKEKIKRKIKEEKQGKLF